MLLFLLLHPGPRSRLSATGSVPAFRRTWDRAMHREARGKRSATWPVCSALGADLP
jgi:hypothetical protein